MREALAGDEVALLALVGHGRRLRELLSEAPRGDIDRVELLAFWMQHGERYLRSSPLEAVVEAFAIGLERRWWAARARRGDKAAAGRLWSSLWEELTPIVERRAAALSLDRDAASDAINAAIRHLLEVIRQGRFEPEPLNSADPLKAYVRSVAINNLSNEARKQRRHREIFVEEEALPPGALKEPVGRLDEVAAVRHLDPDDAALSAIEMLMEQPRRAQGALLLKLHLRHDLTAAELARARGVTVEAMQKRLERAHLWVCETWITEPTLHLALRALGRGDLVRGAVKVMLKLFRGKLRACSEEVVCGLIAPLGLEPEHHAALVRLMTSWWCVEGHVARWHRRHEAELAASVRSMPGEARALLNVFLGHPCGTGERLRRRFDDPNGLPSEHWEDLERLRRRVIALCLRLGQCVLRRVRVRRRRGLPFRLRRVRRRRAGAVGARAQAFMSGLPPPDRIRLRRRSMDRAQPPPIDDIRGSPLMG
ncbi:MAG: hypothetical protein CMH57_08510 [Myxococcales bacterium]|nr:hypothetical protein [Myxococcales bacterium]